MENESTADVLIIGAGIAGLMAARVLEDAGVRVMLIDKGRSVGGRLATRRVGDGLADHGAQFFTARTDTFQAAVDSWIKDKLVYEWSRGFSDGSLMQPDSDGHPRYACNGGMNALAQHLASELKSEIRTDLRIATVTGDEDGWILQDQDGNLMSSHGLIMTAPVPQSLELLDEGATRLEEADFAALARITYAECLTGIFLIDGRVTLPQPGAVQRRNSNIQWIGDNRQKGISQETVITVQAGEQYSRQMWSAPDARVLNALKTDLSIFMDKRAEIKDAQLKRWRYSRPLVTHPDRCLLAEFPSALAFAGDAFGGPRVEGAYLSGLAAGAALRDAL
jgi:renalase